VSHFLILLSRSRLRRYRGRRVPISCFALPDSFSMVPRALGLVFMFCAPKLVFGGTEGADSYFNDLRSQTHFRRYRGRRAPFACFALSDLFSTVPRSSGPIFMFFAPGLVLGGTEGVRSRFHILRSRLIFDGTEDVVSRLHVLCSRTLIRRHRGHKLLFSCFVLPDSFWAVPRTSSPVFMFCAPRHILGGTEDVWSRFDVLRSSTYFGLYWGALSNFHVLRSLTRMRRY
jgi:hypothetical protein